MFRSRILRHSSVVCLTVILVASCEQEKPTNAPRDADPDADPGVVALEESSTTPQPSAEQRVLQAVEVLNEAVSSLDDVGWQELQVEQRAGPAPADWKVVLESEWKLVQAGEPVVPVLSLVLGHQKPQIRQLAARAIGRIGDAKAAGRLADSLEDESYLPARLALAEALGLLGGERAEEALRKASDLPASPGGYWDVKREIKAGLENLGSDGREQLRWEYAQVDESLVGAVEVGRSVPDLMLMDSAGRPVELSSLWSDKTLVLLFLFDEFCMYCQGQVNGFVRSEQLEDLGARVVAIVPRIAERVLPWDDKVGPRMTFLTDPAGRAQALFGIAYQIHLHEQWFPSPTCAVIDRSGVLRFLYRGRAYNDRLDVQKVVKKLRQLPLK